MSAVLQEQAPQLSEEEQAQQRIAMGERLQAFSVVISKHLKEATAGRDASGIEADWIEDEEYYEGIDDANRGQDVVRTKASIERSGLGATEATAPRSNVFLNITGPYVDAVAARIGDVLLPTDDWPWRIEPTPMPDMEKAVGASDAAQPVTMPDGTVQPKGEVADAVLKEAAARAEKAQTRIQDWQTECRFPSEVRKVIDDVARIGTGVLKGPFPIKKQSRSWQNQPDGTTRLIMKKSIVPASKHIDPRNLFPDPSCGENIHNGNYTFERDNITTKLLRDLKDVPDYLNEQIDLCIAEGPKLASMETRKDAQGKPVSDKDQFEIWYYHGMVDAEDLNAAGCPCGEKDMAFALVTMVNDRVIKVALNPLDTGEFPYDVMIYKRRAGHWAGVGVSRQVQIPQRMVNAGCRAMMNNAGLGSGPLIVMKENVEPADGVMGVTPLKIFTVPADADGPVKDYFVTFKIPMVEAELMSIIQFALKMAEDVTGFPMLMQGQQGKAPDVLGIVELLDRNASTVLRRIARLFDDLLTEPHIRRYYDWHMQYSEDPAEKGDFQIKAIGSSTLVERDIQNKELAAMGNIALQPAFGWNPEKWGTEYLKSRRFDPARIQYSDEEKRQIQENAKNSQQQDPRIAAAQIGAATDKEIAAGRDKAAVQKAQIEASRDLDRLNIERDLAMLKYANDRNISLDKVKSQLAQTAMKLKTTKELALADHTVDLHKHKTPPAPKPVVEPPGKAPAGESFQK